MTCSRSRYLLRLLDLILKVDLDLLLRSDLDDLELLDLGLLCDLALRPGDLDTLLVLLGVLLLPEAALAGVLARLLLDGDPVAGDLLDGEALAGDLLGGDLLDGDLLAGDLPLGDLPAGDLLDADLLAGGLLAGDLLAGDLLAGDGLLEDLGVHLEVVVDLPGDDLAGVLLPESTLAELGLVLLRGDLEAEVSLSLGLTSTGILAALLLDLGDAGGCKPDGPAT